MAAPDYIDETIKTTGGDIPFVSSSITTRSCAKCGLHVPPELDACPNDGTVMAKSAQDLLSGRYEMLEMIGKGGMSVIYKARHRLMNNVVAIKLLQEKLSQEKSSFKRFQIEAQAASRLNHPSIIKVLDFGILEHGHTYLVMDHVSGRSLSEVIEDAGTIPPERAIPLFIQICQGLVHAHQNGVLHRDLKPSNLLVIQDENGGERIKIVDFGIAKVLGEEGNKLTSTGEVFGSPLYMSPEQCMGQEVDARSDIYSMGCLMYEALTGVAPHLGTNPLETIYKQMNEEAEPVSAHLKHPLAGQLDVVLKKALCKNREERYQSISELLADLQKVNTGQKLVVKSKPVKPAWIAGYVATLTALGLGVGYFMLHKDDAPPPAPAPVLRGAETDLPRQVSLLETLGPYDLLDSKKLFPQEVWTSIITTSAVKLERTGATDRHCEILGKMPGLTSVDIRSNPEITSKGALAIANSNPRMDVLYADGTSLDNAFINGLNPSYLKKLTIGNTKVTSAAFPRLKKLTNLNEIWLNDLDLSDRDVAQLPTLSNLRRLKLDDNPKLTNGCIAGILAKYPTLDWLTVRGCGMTDACVPLIDKSRISVFGVYRTKISKTVKHSRGRLRLGFAPVLSPGSKEYLQKMLPR